MLLKWPLQEVNYTLLPSYGSRTSFRCVARPVILPSTPTPGCRHLPQCEPLPCGDPVITMSPGCNDINGQIYEISFGLLKFMSLVSPCCIGVPFSDKQISRS